MRELPRGHPLVTAGVAHGDVNQWPAGADAMRAAFWVLPPTGAAPAPSNELSGGVAVG